MYQGKRNILNKEKYEALRAEEIKYLSGAVAVAMSELDGILNYSEVARQYFGRSQSWLSQRLNGCMRENRQMAFTPEEAIQLAKAFKDIARRLQVHADEIIAVAHVE